MKTERVTLLTTPEFKAFLVKRASQEGVSVAELIRRRFDDGSGGDDAALAELTAELRRAVAGAKRSLAEGLAETRSVLAELRGEAAGAAAVGARPAARIAGKRAVRA